jgi:hypothetical protein
LFLFLGAKDFDPGREVILTGFRLFRRFPQFVEETAED